MLVPVGLVSGIIGLFWLIGPEPFRKLWRWFSNCDTWPEKRRK